MYSSWEMGKALVRVRAEGSTPTLADLPDSAVKGPPPSPEWAFSFQAGFSLTHRSQSPYLHSANNARKTSATPNPPLPKRND